MTRILALLSVMFFAPLAFAGDYSYYVKIGAGYKIFEPEHAIATIQGVEYRVNVDNGSPISARMELGVEKGNITFGISHHSQWLEGWPVNDNGEYSKTEVFIDYKYTFGQ